jgi:hypothetical protein
LLFNVIWLDTKPFKFSLLQFIFLYYTFHHLRKVSSLEKKIKAKIFYFANIKAIPFSCLNWIQLSIQKLHYKDWLSYFSFKWGQVLLALMMKTILLEGRLPVGFTVKSRPESVFPKPLLKSGREDTLQVSEVSTV